MKLYSKKLKHYFSILLIGFLFNACEPALEAKNTTKQPIPDTSSVSAIVDTIPIGLKKLIAAYPEQKLSATKNSLIWPDGSEMTYEDTVSTKSYEELLNSPDLEDQLSMPYLEGVDYETPTRNQDPGRIRFEPFFFKMYGATKEEVRKNLVAIDFLGAKLQVTKINGIDKKLTQVAEELAKYPELKKYLENVGGTFNWRKIAGTDRISMHSFGMTIDINIKYSNYWRWAVADKTEDGKRPIIYKNRIPLEIVKIFEDNGFIWGGKWYHYDTMHFEYRPELLKTK